MPSLPPSPTTAPTLEPRVGTAGWALPGAVQDRFAGTGSHLARYAVAFTAAEINSTFRRSHRPATYLRWAASVPEAFRFAVKLPQAITHRQRLAGTDHLVDAFLSEIAPLHEKLGCLLVQLPPGLALDDAVAWPFLESLRARFDRAIALEPRHPGWFAPGVSQRLSGLRIARVAADPARVPDAGLPGGWPGFAYYRLHGSPRMYYSAYPVDALAALARRLRAHTANGTPAWCIFDNTTLGAATADALALQGLLDVERPR